MSQLDQEITQLKHKYKSLQSNPVLLGEFSDFPLSKKTLKGLRDANFVTPTKIQVESILSGLLGKNVVAVAETGSGKTLAFLIPVLEKLFLNKWSRTDGLAALVISPTRELAYQLFETFRKIGKYHDFSAALIIGGKNLHFEKSRVDQCNILICTPGRLLQHMDENPLFDAHNLEIFVLDEADRCLDMGFEACLNAIIKNLPPNRQTLLFSATQNYSDFLNRLHLQNPFYVGKIWREKEKVAALPELLKQSYVVVDLEKKITMIWSFITSHLKQKIVVFLSSCKQAKYTFEIFCKLRPGISLLALYGTLSQDRRISIYNEFFKRNHGVLFATDIASRGLDFQDVNWVVQLDCPEDVTQYIHRAGRSARNKSSGENILVLMPSEENVMIADLKKHNIHLRKIDIDRKKLFSPAAKIKAFCARSPDLKLLAQKAFIAYLKSVFLMKNKLLFDVKCLNTEKFAESLGLITAPRLRFIERNMKSDWSMGAEIDHDDFFKIKRPDHSICDEEKFIHPEEKKKSTKVSIAKKLLKKNNAVNQILRYDAKGIQINCFGEVPLNYNEKQFDLNGSQQILLQEDKHDKERFKAIVKIRHKKLKEKRKRIQNQNEMSDENSSDEYLNQTNGNKRPPKIKIFKKSADAETASLKDVENIATQLLTYNSL